MVCDFLTGLQIFDLSPGVMLTKNCESHFGQLVFTWEQSAKGGGYAKQHPQSILQHFSNSIINKQQQASKIWPLHLIGGVVK